jgi:hypothetical protein
MIEEIYFGRISWYRSYNSHGYDGSKIIQDYLTMDGNLYQLKISNRKKKLREIFKDYPEFLAKVEEGIEGNDELLVLIKEFDNLVKSEHQD